MVNVDSPFDYLFYLYKLVFSSFFFCFLSHLSVGNNQDFHTEIFLMNVLFFKHSYRVAILQLSLYNEQYIVRIILSYTIR